MGLTQFINKRERLFLLLLTCFGFQTGFAQSNNLSNKLLNASSYTINADDELRAYMTGIAEASLNEHCVECHGANLEGKTGVPNLVDYDWLWGITGLETNSVEPVMKIMQTILYGVRNTECPDDIKSYGACPDTRFSQMPAYGVEGYSEQQVNDFVEYVVDLSGGEADAEAIARIESLKVVCAECHGEDSYGYQAYGGPNLRDKIWLFGGEREQIRDVIHNGRTETCPAWVDVIEPVAVKAMAVYIYNKAFAY